MGGLEPGPFHGFVTNLKIGCNEAPDRIGSRTDGYNVSPLTKIIVSSFAVLGCGDQMAANVEDVVDVEVAAPSNATGFTPAAACANTGVRRAAAEIRDRR